MHRRAALVTSGVLLFTPLLTAPIATGTVAAVDAVVAVVAPEPTPVTTSPPQIGDNEFLPDDADLTECVGLLQRPGCGSSERGGWRQTVVFAVLIAGLAVVFGRVAWAMRSRDARSPSGTPTPSSQEQSVDDT